MRVWLWFWSFGLFDCLFMRCLVSLKKANLPKCRVYLCSCYKQPNNFLFCALNVLFVSCSLLPYHLTWSAHPWAWSTSTTLLTSSWSFWTPSPRCWTRPSTWPSRRPRLCWNSWQTWRYVYWCSSFSYNLKFITLNNTKFYDFVKEGLRAASQSEVFCQRNPLGPINSSLLMLLKGALLLISLSRLSSQGPHHAPGQFVRFSYCRSPCLYWSILPLAGYILNPFHKMGRAVQF